MDKGIKVILDGDDKCLKRALFNFSLSKYTDKQILFKFNLWVRHTFPKQFKAKDAPFHSEIDLYNLQAYRGSISAFLDIVFRGGAKTTRTKLFFSFVIICDEQHYRRFIKVLTKDISNAKQIVTDVHNILINDRVKDLYPKTFRRTNAKREKTMASFTTAFGVKLKAGSVGTDQRGQVQGDEESARPDLIWFDDFETRKTIRSAVESNAIFDNMEEARTGLSKDGSCIYTCNYITERANVHRLVQSARQDDNQVLLIVPIIKNGVIAWNYYTMEDINSMKRIDKDFEGERLCEPSAGLDVMFDRKTLDNMEGVEPIKTIAGFKMFHKYDPSHRYGVGADVAGGVGLDSSTSVHIDFSTIPARVVGTFASNMIQPEPFGDELYNQSTYFGKPIIAPENNKFDSCIGRLKVIYDNIYYTEGKASQVGAKRPKSYGWNTNAGTKPKMIFDVKKAIHDGLLVLSDINLINEFKSYSRNDLMDNDDDVRLTTRHFDLLIACAIAWQMKDWAVVIPTEKPNDLFLEHEFARIQNAQFRP